MVQLMVSLRLLPDLTHVRHKKMPILNKTKVMRKRGLTKRAPDAGDSAASSFLRLSIFLAGRLRRPRPGCRVRRDTLQVTQAVGGAHSPCKGYRVQE